MATHFTDDMTYDNAIINNVNRLHLHANRVLMET